MIERALAGGRRQQTSEGIIREEREKKGHGLTKEGVRHTEANKLLVDLQHWCPIGHQDLERLERDTVGFDRVVRELTEG